MVASSPTVSVVLPTYNESENILKMLAKLHSVLAAIPHEVLVVDDDSKDLTWQIVEKFSVENPWARSIRRVGEKGLSSAVLKGFDEARGKIFAVMDADMSHDENILPKMIQACENGVDLVVGSRRIAGGGFSDWPWYRRLTSGSATVMAKVLLNINLSDPMSGYFVLNRDLYARSKSRLSPLGYKILLEMACKAKPNKILEVPFVFKDREFGNSKLSGSVIFEYLVMLSKLFAYRMTHA